MRTVFDLLTKRSITVGRRGVATSPRRPLEGIRVIELGGLAPAPFAGMVLADFGAHVCRVERPKSTKDTGNNIPSLGRHKDLLRLDLRDEESRNVLSRMTEECDVLIEPFRPGVMERLSLGPEDLMPNNEKLIYARMTGFGQGGVHEKEAGHDINYLAQSGVLSMLRTQGHRPNPPVNILADFAGGGAMCAMGILLALIERSTSGMGQVVDAAMIDGTCYLSTFLWKMIGSNVMSNSFERVGTSLLDGGCPFYRCYACEDERHVAVGCLEPQFFRNFVSRLRDGGADVDLPSDEVLRNMHSDPKCWPKLEAMLDKTFRTRPMDAWASLFDGHDCCVTPVLSAREAENHEHMKDRRVFSAEVMDDDSVMTVPSPAPRLSRTPALDPASSEPRVDDPSRALSQYGFSKSDIENLISKGVVS